MDERYLKFFELFNEREFYECHEVLEDLWMETVGDERPYYQGLIQTATAFYHLENGNLAGARKLFDSGLHYLDPFADEYMGFDLGAYRLECREWHDRVKRKSQGERVEIDLETIPTVVGPKG